jgi:site-specific recombinase XerD
MSPHTLSSYRDSVTLLLRYLAARRRIPVDKLDIADLDAERIVAFLQDLEDTRGSSVATRNVRLAAIHAFFRYLAASDPNRIEQSQRILGVPFKRARARPVEYLEYEEIQAVLASISRTTASGRRDYAMLATMFNTGARVQEILDLRACDLRLGRPAHARLVGKGRKERACPLWPQTAGLLKNFLAESATPVDSDRPLFLNSRGQPLTRFGVRYLLRKHCDGAQAIAPSLQKKRLHPHSMRHSTAIHLLKSGVDFVTISQWLGHASANTTNRYATVDIEMKRAAISKAQPPRKSRSTRRWRNDPSLLAWLEAL